MKSPAALAVLIAVSLVLPACGGSGENASGFSAAPTTLVDENPVVSSEPFVAGEAVLLDLPRADTAATDADVVSVVSGDWNLGLDLLRVAGGEANSMVSPYSVATALSMLYAGARGETASEISEVLNLKVDDETLHEVRNTIDSALISPQPSQDEDDTREPFAIRPANAAWGQGGYPFLDEYLRVLATHYGAGLRVVDFIGDPSGSVEIINEWTEEATEGRIQDLISPDVIDEVTRLVLVNAIWFKGNWAEQFDPAATSEGSFTLLDGRQTTVPFMRTSIRTGYFENDIFQAVRLPYTGDAAMVVALPRTGTPVDLAAVLDPGASKIPWSDYLVELSLPRFQFESDLKLKETLQALGMRSAFVPPPGGADLTGIAASGELYVSEALHKTFVAVDEHGTEASAATAIIIGVTSAPTPVTFTVDRPFLFWIEHTSTGEPLFLGQVINPEAQ